MLNKSCKSDRIQRVGIFLEQKMTCFFVEPLDLDPNIRSIVRVANPSLVLRKRRYFTLRRKGTHVFFHRVQDEGLELVQTVVYPGPSPLLHDGLVALKQTSEANDQPRNVRGPSASLGIFIGLQRSKATPPSTVCSKQIDFIFE